MIAPKKLVWLKIPGRISRERDAIGRHIGKAKSVGFRLLVGEFSFHVAAPILIEVFHGR
ncbi:hypothetical protein NXT3_PB00022 (plasmid) [Sinorhizobium fredii]|uniref:Uncharacterized protein n=1 Tax=Rhizobium fredii TaxID=380 RepID=A0A2L0HB41_RHIFR|nr:hypothetical protein NXT3_PB00022 [Sinorhizobium fredii]